MNTETIILLVFFCIITATALVISSIALYDTIHVKPRQVLPSTSPAVSFVPLTESGTFNIASQKVATPAVAETYKVAYTNAPFLIINATDNLSGQPCQPYITTETKTGFTTGVLSCPKNGFFVNTASDENIQMTQFTVNNIQVPAILYVHNTNLYYQLATDTKGFVWNAPKLLSSTFPAFGGKKLLNVDNNPVVAWLGSTVEFNFIKGDGPTWTTDLIPLVTIVLPGTNPVSVDVFDMIIMPTGFPTAIVQEKTIPSNKLQGVVCGDAGTNGGWTAAWTITQAGTNDIVSLVPPLEINSAIIRIINGKPAVTYTTLATLLAYSQNAAATFPWTAPPIVITATDAIPNNLEMVTLSISNVVVPVLLCSDLTGQYILPANDIDGATWTYANRININAVGGFNAFFGNMISANNQLLISFIDNLRNAEYVVVPNTNLAIANNNINMKNIDPTVGHTNFSAMAIIDNGIAFSYIYEGQLFYFRPPAGTLNLDTSHQINYSAIGI
jgi:hypothetical protein